MLYHVTTTPWDGGDLVPSCDVDAFCAKWPQADSLAIYHAFVVHMYADIQDALDHHANWDGCDILCIDDSLVIWEIDDLEFPHPIAKRVPSQAITLYKGE